MVDHTSSPDAVAEILDLAGRLWWAAGPTGTNTREREALRSAVAVIVAERDDWEATAVRLLAEGDTLRDQNDQLRAEVERLRADLRITRSSLDACRQDAND